jgi:HEAT repeat protein
MPLQTTCSSCGTPCTLSEALLGKKVRCPHCRQVFVAEAPPAPEESGVEIVEEPQPEPEPEAPEEVLPAPRPRPRPARRSTGRLSPALTAPPQKRVPSVIGRELQAGLVYVAVSTVAGLILMAVVGLFVWPWFSKLEPGGGSRNETDLNVLLKNLQAADDGTRQRAAERLGQLKPDEGRRAEVAAALADRLKDKNGWARDAAARALVSWATREQVPALLEVLDHESGAVRESALEALGNLKDSRAVAPVSLRLLVGSDRKHASKSLQAMGSMAEKEVLKRLDESDADGRAECCRVLKRIGTQESVAPLQKLKDRERDQNVRVAAMEALTALKGRP